MAQDALARAREIAAKLSGALGGGSDLGKRKGRWDEDGSSGPGLGSLQRKKIYIPQATAEINYLGLLIGPKGSTQKQLSELTGAKIIIRGKGATKDGGTSNTGHPDDSDELHVALEGSEEALAKASKEIDQIINNPEYAQRLKAQQLLSLNGGSSGGSDNIYGPSGGVAEGYQIELRVPNNMVGLVIGKGGENVLRIQAQLGVHCQIQKEHEMEPGETLRSIVLKGTPPMVAEAKKRIDDIISAQIAKNSGVSNVNNASKDLNYAFVVKLPVPNDKVGIIIGRGGLTIKGIQDRSATQVQIPPNPDEDNPNVRTLAIGGDSKEAVDSAQMEIFMALQNYAANSATNQAANALLMAVPDDKVGIIIGKGGATVKDIQNRLRVKIQIPPAAEPGSYPPIRNISIAGPLDMQPVAKYEIEMILAGTPLNNPGQGGGAGIYGDPYGGGAGMYGGGGGGAGMYGGYGAAPAMDPYANAYGQQSYYGSTVAGGAAGYGGYGAATTPTAAASSAGAAGTAPADPNDPTAYYNEYWLYSTYYGEAAARQFYGAWSPPEGTPPPAGIVPLGSTAGSASSATDGAAPLPATSAAVEQIAATPATADTSTAAAASADPEAAQKAWEEYKKQYTEWYEAHGKAAGADPNPPGM